MTGILLLETGQVEANLPRLNETFRLPFIPDLIAQKQREAAALATADLDLHQRTINQLRERLETAWQNSSLPVEPANRPELNDFMVRVRLGASDG